MATVTWAEPEDADIIEVWRALWHDGTLGVSAYPEYDDIQPPPLRPVDYAAVNADTDWQLMYTLNAGIGFQLDYWIAAIRGVYYYEIFVRDAAGNVSPVSVTSDRSISYWLGDFNLDGFVSVADVTILAAAYSTLDGEANYNAETDVGPTDDSSGVGTPTTDDEIFFEDLMIVALVYGEVGPNTGPPITAATAVATDASTAPVPLAWYRAAAGQWALQLTAPAPELKGLRLRVALPAGTTAEVSAGNLLLAQPDYFLQEGQLVARMSPAGNATTSGHGMTSGRGMTAGHGMTSGHGMTAGIDVSLAVLGAEVGITGRGELLRVALPPGVTPGAVAMELRSLHNTELDWLPAEPTAVLPEAVLAYTLMPNQPNPFNPQTVIRFQLPERKHVKLQIYSVDGRLVTTLIDRPIDRGRHSVTWQGRDSADRGVAAGTYFYRLEAGDYQAVRKMVLLK
jgi:hypothetical protein